MAKHDDQDRGRASAVNRVDDASAPSRPSLVGCALRTSIGLNGPSVVRRPPEGDAVYWREVSREQQRQAWGDGKRRTAGRLPPDTRHPGLRQPPTLTALRLCVMHSRAGGGARTSCVRAGRPGFIRHTLPRGISGPDPGAGGGGRCPVAASRRSARQLLPRPTHASGASHEVIAPSDISVRSLLARLAVGDQPASGIWLCRRPPHGSHSWSAAPVILGLSRVSSSCTRPNAVAE